MYKHLIPKKDQLFRRQVKQAFEQRQKPQTSKPQNHQATFPIHFMQKNQFAVVQAVQNRKK